MRQARSLVFRCLGCCLIAGALPLAAGPLAETVEEIVAWVNDDIITRSALDEREQMLVAELFGKLSGEELDRQLSQARVALLKDMISEKLLLQQAERLYDMKKMQESLMKNFKEQEKITNDDDLAELLKGEGMTIDDLRRRLVEYNAPQSVIQYEVRDKVSVSDAEVESFHRENSSQLAEPEQVTFREIVFLSEGRGLDQAIELARQTAEQIRSGADIDKLAREKSEAASRERGGLIGPFRRGELNPDIEKAAFALPIGQISDPIATPHGAHLIRVDSRTEGKVPSLEEARERIYDRIEKEKFRQNLTAYLERLWGGADIEVAKSYLDKISPEYRRFVKEPPSGPIVR